MSKTIVIYMFSICAFLAGLSLLVTGSLPLDKVRVDWIREFIPTSVLEVSHFLGSLIGVALLFLARAIQRRIDTAYYTTIMILLMGIVVSLGKGFYWELSLSLSVLVMVFIPSRKLFYRKTSLLTEEMSFQWFLTISLSVAGALCIGLWQFQDVAYSDHLWWKFGFNAGAPRFLRMSLGVGICLGIIFCARLYKTNSFKPQWPSDIDFLQVYECIQNSPNPANFRALFGDKFFIFSSSKKSFLMCALRPKSLVILGDPVGPSEEWSELLLEARRTADLYDLSLVFVGISKHHVHYYLDIGLKVIKLGEEARIDLKSFTLQGKERNEIRRVVNRFEKDGYVFEIVPQVNTPDIMHRLKVISDEWLKDKKTREKGFSLGSFNEKYLSYSPTAIVKKNGHIIAFCNLWITSRKDEISGDLMRYAVKESPNGVMDFLFTKLMLWAQAEGYQHFNMGMAPLSGLGTHGYGGFWALVGTWIYNHGTRFYNFHGLRQYKEKYAPQWESKYIASTGRMTLPRILLDIATLNSRGLKGILLK